MSALDKNQQDQLMQDQQYDQQKRQSTSDNIDYTMENTSINNKNDSQQQQEEDVNMNGIITTTSVSSPTHSSFSRKSESSHSSHTTTSTTNNNKRPQQNDHDYRQRMTYSESDQELYIRSLSESLMIHKEIVERIEYEKEQYMEMVERERKLEREAAKATTMALEEQQREYERLQLTYQHVLNEMEKRKQEYQRMESNYYSHVRQIRATDDDLSTIQSEISHLFSQVGNLCMGLRSKADREAGTAFIMERWADKQETIRDQLLKEGEETLDTGYIGLFIEKYIVEVILDSLLRKPLQPGVSINDAYQQVEEWFFKRNPEWATRLRQQASALVAKQPEDEEESIAQAKQKIVQSVLETIGRVCPKIKGDLNQEKKVSNIIHRAAKLNLAIKGQELPVETKPIEEGVIDFDGDCMKAASKGKAEGTVLLVITPAFAATDPNDAEHGFLVPAKVLCV
ncbi:hypothetical protein INT45_004716 [Circinella minor]|uniref:Uncharacterized protein n=1 Tax=Circinella minor TaxID=1195481 RepID=A0A8H7SE18_9FUNG|nr:hypothetical protein INT45_004716 [Circinella minor]